MQHPPGGPPHGGSHWGPQGQPHYGQRQQGQQHYGQPPYQQPARPGASAPLSMRKRVDLALRASLFLLTIVVALVVGIGTDLGHDIDMLQAGGPGGLYSPKLTMLILILICALPTILVYFPIKLFFINRLPDS